MYFACRVCARHWEYSYPEKSVPGPLLPPELLEARVAHWHTACGNAMSEVCRHARESSRVKARFEEKMTLELCFEE